MKKIALTLAGVMAAAVFAPEASAIPAFARQTGMACSACHFQKFPVLNGFGRAFKASGYVMMGAQGKIEGEHLSLPETLNAAILFKYRYVQDSAKGTSTTTAGAGQTAATAGTDGQWQMGDEFSLFFGGRMTENEHFAIGFLNENNLAAGSVINTGTSGQTANRASVNMPLVAGLRVPIVVPMGDAKISVVPFTTDGLGVSYGYELSSGGIMRANRFAELRRETSAVQYNADRGDDGGMAAGTAFVFQNEMGFINYTKWSSSFAPGAGGGWVPSTNFGQTYIRAAATPSVAGFDLVVGGGQMSGTSYGNIVGAQMESKQTFLDLQAHGVIAGMEAGIYVQNATAPACTTATGGNCVYNTKTNDRKATTVAAEFSVIPHTLTLGLAYRSAENGAAANNKDNALTFTSVYDLAQNVALHLDYASYSGDANDNTGNRLLGMLEAAW